MNLNELLKKATPAHEPLFTGAWATILFKPDLGSRQEFVIGVVAALNSHNEPHIKWLPSFSRLSKLYGDAMPSTEITGLTVGCSHAISNSFRTTLESVDSGTPHLRIDICGYLSADDIDAELTFLLKRHSGGIWTELGHREDSVDDDWAYAQMLKAIERLNVRQSIIVKNRRLIIGHRELAIAFDNGESYASVVSARYANYSTVERHIYQAHIEVTSAHKLSKRSENPALFVILPPVNQPDEITIRQKSLALLRDIEDTGIQPFASDDAVALAEKVERWAGVR